MNTTAKFFSTLFNSGQKSIDPATFNVNQFNEAQTAPDAMALLRFSVDSKSDEYIKSALNMIYRLYHQDNTNNIAVQFGDLGICPILDSIFTQKTNDIQLSNHCLQVMYILIASPNGENPLTLTIQSQRKSSTEQSVSSSLLVGLPTLTTSDSIKVLSSVVGAPSTDLSANRKRLSNSGTIFRIIKCGQLHINEVSLLLSVLKVLREFLHDIGTISRLVSCGVCDLLTQMLRQHTLNETILPIICELMYQLILTDLDDCDGSNHCQNKFAEFYVCEQLIIKILSNSSRLTSLSIVWVLKAIGALSRRHEDNKKRFAAADTCSIIPKMSQELSMEDSLLAEAICWAIGNLAFPDEVNQLQLGDQGSCAVILTILKAHSQNRIVVQEGMRALRNLCQSCEANVNRFIDLQGIAFCMELVRLFIKEPDVLQWIMYAIAAMCSYETARTVFGEEKIAVLIAGIFHQFATSANEDIIQWTSLVAAQVAKDPELAAELHDLNLCGDLIQAIVCHSKNSDVIEELLNVLTSLALVSERSRISFIESSVHDLLLKFLVDFEGVETTVEQTLVAFSSVLRLAQESVDVVQPAESMLCRHSFQADDRAVSSVKLAKVYKLFVGGCWVQSNALKLLAKVISKNYENEFIALHGVQSLAGLALGSFLIDRSDIVQSDRVLSVLRVGLFSNSRGMLGVLGDANVINTLCIITASHLTDTAIVKWSLYSLLQLCSIEKNMEVLRQSDICLIVSKLLEIYYISSEEEATSILILIFGLVVQLCVFPELRVQLGNYFTPGAGSGLPTHSLLTAIAHHLVSVDSLRAGSEAMSALCISPLEDALSAVYRQEQSERRKSNGSSLGGRSSFTAMTMNLTGTPTTPSLNQQQRSNSEADTLDWINFPSADKGEDGNTETSSVQASEQTSAGEGVMTSTARNLFGFASFFKASTHKETAESTEQRDDTSTSNASDRKRTTTISTIDAYNSLLPPPGVSGNNLLFEAASNIISTGLSDQEELLIAQKSNLKLKSRKSSGESLVENGAVALLVAAMQSHPTHEGVLCATLNTLNSLAVFPTNRQKFDDPLIYEVLINILTSFAGEQLPSLSREPLAKADSTEEVADDQSSSLPLTPLKKPDVGNDPSTRRLSTKSLQTQLEASRAVRILLLVVIGTICMPVADEELHQTNSKSHRKNLATNAYSFHEVNQEQFGSLGVIPVVLDMLTAYTFDSLICEAALRAIYFLVKGNTQNQSRFSTVSVKVEEAEAEGEEGVKSEGSLNGGRGIVLLVDILKQNQDKPRVVYYACLAIAAVAGSHSDNASFLGERGICALVGSILEQYLEKAEIVQACCQVISSLTFLNEQWNHHHVCELVLRALVAHSNSAVVAEWVCRAIGSLAEYKENKIELDQHQVAKTLTMALQKHVSADNLLFSAFTKDTSSPGVARWGCTAIYYLLDDGHLLNDRKAVPQLQASMIAAGACEAVAKALVKYSEVETVAYACCRALVLLLLNNEAYKVKLGGLGVCSCVVESLHLFPASALVAEWGCRAAAVLAENNESNIAKLAVAGACETIPLVLQAHPHNEQVAIAGSDVISFMSVHLASGYAARFGHAGACEAVVSVLRKHTANAPVVARASIALAALARVSGNARWFGPAGGAEALYSAICLHKHDNKVAKYVASAVGNLCLVDHNKERLGSIGVCEEIIDIAKFHQRDLETAIAASAAIWKLCETIHKHKTVKAAASKEVLEEGVRVGVVDDVSKTSSETSKEVNEAERVRLQRIQQSLHYREGRHNRAILLDSEVCQTLVQLLNFHLADATAAKTICHAISVLATPGAACAEEREQLGQLGVCVAIVKALSFHEGNEDVSRWGCLAVRALCHQSPENQQRFHETQLPSLLVLNLRGFRQAVDLPDHQALMEAVLGAVINFASGHQNNKAVLGECGACEGLLELLDLHVRNQEIIYLTVKALFHICDGNQLNRMKISFSGAADFLMTCLTKYPDEDKMVDFVLGIMIGMGFDKVGQSRLGTVGMCKHVSQLITKYEKTSDYLTVLSVCLVGTLARNSKSNQEKLGLTQVHRLIIPLLQKAVTSAANTSSATTSPTNAATSSGFLSKTISSLRRNSILPASTSSPPNSPDAAMIEALTNANNLADTSGVATSESEESQSPNVSLSEYIGDFSLAKECCRALYHLTSDNEANRQRVNSSSTNNANVIDTLTAILASNDEAVFNEEVKVWAKKAMEALFTSSQAQENIAQHVIQYDQR